MQTQVFVTGGTGFLGAYLLQRLTANPSYKVFALKRKNSSLDLLAPFGDKIEWIEGDVMNAELLYEVLPKMDQVYHTAAVVSYQKRDRQAMFATNIQGTANMVNAALEAQVKKFLFVSSIAALGRKESKTTLDEKATWESNSMNTLYGVSKFHAECEVWRGIEEGLPALIINPSVIIGSGYWGGGSTKFFTQIQQGFPYFPPGATGFVDVRDVAAVAVLLMESEQVNERYIVNAENLSYQVFFTLIGQALGRKKGFRPAPSTLVRVVSILSEIRAQLFGGEALLSRDTLRTLNHQTVYSNDKIVAALSYSFTPIQETIQQTAAQLLDTANPKSAMLPSK